MIKKNKWALLISSLLILLPMAAGGILWSRLPEQIPVHFGAQNEPNGWGNRAFVVFGMPLLMLVLHWFCVAVTAADPKRKNIGEKPMKLVFWIIPAMTLMVFHSGRNGLLRDNRRAVRDPREPAAEDEAELHLRHQTAVDA